LERIVTTFQLNTTANLYASVGYIPQPTDWKELSVVLSAGAAAAPEVMVRFESINGGGNNLYLDDIRLSYRIGLDDNEAPTPGLVAYPNPGQDRVVLHGPEGALRAPGDWTATDLLGRTMWTAPASEDAVLEVDTRLWPVGVYWFRRGADAVRWVKG
jgi:hypothetical protein